jgi:hypothetical protein
MPRRVSCDEKPFDYVVAAEGDLTAHPKLVGSPLASRGVSRYYTA